MSRTDHVPTYRLHRQSGQAVVTLPDGLGGRRDVLLGKFNTKASRVEYTRALTEWEAAGRTLLPALATPALTVNELIVSVWSYAEQHYRRPDGTPGKELEDFQLSLRAFRRLYGHTAAKDFGPLAFKAVLLALVDGSWMTYRETAAQPRRGYGARAGFARKRPVETKLLEMKEYALERMEPEGSHR
jgi:hypothetical protein